MSQRIVASHHKTQTGNIRAYTTGFALSLILTAIPYMIVVNHWLSDGLLVAALVACALGQLAVQLKYFIHLGHESGLRWNAIVFTFTAVVVGIVVIGTLWIMNNLDYNMMPDDMDRYMQKQQSKGGF